MSLQTNRLTSLALYNVSWLWKMQSNKQNKSIKLSLKIKLSHRTDDPNCSVDFTNRDYLSTGQSDR